MRRISIGFATTTLVLLVLGFFYLPRSSTVFAQVVEQLRQAKSFRCKVKMTLSEKAKKEIKPEEFAPMPEMLFYWNAPNSMRNETLKDDKLIQVSVQPSGKPGIEIDYLKKTVRKVPARQSSPSPLILMDNLAHFAGIADRDLGKAVIAGEEVQGFEVAASKIDPDQTVSRVRVWFNPKTKLPVAVEQDYDAFVQRMEDFHWNETTHDWFNINVPEDFRDVSPVPPTLDEITARAVTTFRIFAKYSGGKYPQVKTIDGDVMHSELLRNAGISLFPKREQLSDPVYQECQKAQNGISTIYLIQQENPDAAYYGKEVDSGDKVKILLRWKLSNGEYRVIYGDLHYEDVSLDVLRQLESKK